MTPPEGHAAEHFGLAGLRPGYLRCEYAVDPLGIDALAPRLSWEPPKPRGVLPFSEVDVMVASSPDLLAAGRPDRWHHRSTDSQSFTHVHYAGTPLAARDRCWWVVRLGTTDGLFSEWSEPAYFEMGLLSPSAAGNDGSWMAQLIRAPLRGDRENGAPAPYLRRSFELDESVAWARLYVTAFGLYEIHVNGQVATSDLYRPGWTDYRVRIPYQCYDVGRLLRRGENVIGALLGDGWYCGHNPLSGGRQTYGERPALLAQLEIWPSDASRPLVIGTDAQWRVFPSPIRANDNDMGEDYDARSEQPGWAEPGYDDSQWEPAEAGGGSLSALVATVAPPVRVTDELTPIGITREASGVHIVDIGQNMVGHVRLRVDGQEGASIRLRHAEMLQADGTLWTDGLGRARATDTYVCAGDGVAVWEPKFTFHGFRYVEVTGAPGDLDADAITGIVKHSDMPRTGWFECSNPSINRLYENIVWSQRGNFLDVPTDCPQRYERVGWTGDIAMFARTAAFNFDVAAFLTKWTDDLLDAQIVGGIEDGQFPMIAPRGVQVGGGPGWSDAAILVPWTIYEVYDDLRPLERAYPALIRWMEFLDRHDKEMAPGAWAGFGDWVSLDYDADNPVGPDDRFGGTPQQLLRRAFHAHAADLMSRTANALGRSHDAQRWSEKFDSLRSDFADEHLGARGLVNPSQTACALALEFDLIRDPDQLGAIAQQLAEDVETRGHLVTGFLGTPFLLHALDTIRRTDLAYQLLERSEFPSWLYPVINGATTMWERWDSWTPENGFHPHGMNSFNHYAYGSVGHWLHRTVGGLDLASPATGYQRIRIAPRPGGSISWAKTTLRTNQGIARCEWHREGPQFAVEIDVPPNSVAEVRLPDGTEHEVGAGAHSFRARIPAA